MHFFEETFFRGAQKKDDLQFFFIRNTSHRYIVRDLTLETKETPEKFSHITFHSGKNMACGTILNTVTSQLFGNYFNY